MNTKKWNLLVFLAFIIVAVTLLLGGCLGCGGSKSSVVGTNDNELPADPGEAGTKTLAGIDSDGDGLRDDVQRHIFLIEKNESAQIALVQMAKVQQDLLLIGEDKGEALLLAAKLSKVIDCLFYLDEDAALGRVVSLKAALLNTEQRIAANIEANQLLSGSTFNVPHPESWGAGCEQ